MFLRTSIQGTSSITDQIKLEFTYFHQFHPLLHSNKPFSENEPFLILVRVDLGILSLRLVKRILFFQINFMFLAIRLLHAIIYPFICHHLILKNLWIYLFIYFLMFGALLLNPQLKAITIMLFF